MTKLHLHLFCIALILHLFLSCKEKDRTFTSHEIRDEIINTLDTVLGKNARFTWVTINRTSSNQYSYTVYGYKENDNTTFYGLLCKAGKWDTIGIYAVSYQTAAFTLAEINNLKYMPEYVRKIEGSMAFQPGPQFRKVDEIDIKSNNENQSQKVSLRYIWNQPEGPPVSMPFNGEDQFKAPK